MLTMLTPSTLLIKEPQAQSEDVLEVPHALRTDLVELPFRDEVVESGSDPLNLRLELGRPMAPREGQCSREKRPRPPGDAASIKRRVRARAVGDHPQPQAGTLEVEPRAWPGFRTFGQGRILSSASASASSATSVSWAT